MTPRRTNQTALPEREPLWTRSFIVMTLCYFCLFLCLQMLLTPFPFYVKDRFGPDDFTVSLVTSLFALTAIAARFATAWLMGKVNRNILLLAGVLIAAGATAAYSFADTLAGVLVLRICFGLGFGMGSTLMPTMVTQLIPAKRLGEGVGYFGLSTNLAMSIGPVVGLSVLHAFGFPVLTIWGTVAVAAILPLFALRGRSKPDASQAPAVSSVSSSTGSGMNAAILFPAALNVLLSACYGGLLSFLALYGKEIGMSNIGLFFLFNVVTVLAVRPLSGKLYDKYGHAVVLVPGALAVAVSLLLLAATKGFPLLAASGLLFGMGYGAIQPTIQAWMLKEVDRNEHGKINSLFYNTIDFGVASGAMLLGAVASAVGYSMMYRYSACIMLLFIVLYGAYRYFSKPAGLDNDLDVLPM